MKRTLIVALLTLGSVLPLFGQRPWLQWQPEEGIEVRTNNSYFWNRASATRTEGEDTPETAILWAETKQGVNSYYAQIIRPDGSFAFPDSSCQVSHSVEVKWYPSVVADPVEGWFAAWYSVTGPQFQERMTIRFTKFNRDGELLWQEGWLEVPAYSEFGSEAPAPVVPDGQGGCFIVWLDERGGGDIYAHHITADGEPDDVWGNQGRVLISRVGAQDQLKATTDGSGGIIIVCRSHRERSDGDIYAQRVGQNGNALWNGAAGLPVCIEDSSNQELPDICADGRGGAYITWLDSRGDDIALYANRVSAEGNLYWLNSDSGAVIRDSDVASAVNSTVKLIASENETATVFWKDYRGSNNNRFVEDLYAQRFGGTDNMAKLWAEDQGMPVVIAPSEQHVTGFTNDRDGGLYVVWEDSRDEGFPYCALYGQRFNRNGQPLWRANGILLREGDDMPLTSNIHVGGGGALLLWSNLFRMNAGIFAQSLNAETGRSEWGQNGRLILEGGIQGEARLAKLITQLDDQGTFAVLWNDGRYGGLGMKQMIQFFTNENAVTPSTPPGMSNGTLLTSFDSSHAQRAEAIPDGEGGVIAVWGGSDPRGMYYYAQKISAAGELQWGEHAIKLPLEELHGQTPGLANDDKGGVFIAYEQRNRDNTTDLRLQRISREGQLLFGDSSLNITQGRLTNLGSLRCASDGEGGALIVWENEIENDGDIWMSRVDSTGSPVWDEAIRPLCTQPADQYATDIISHPDGWFVVWSDRRDADSLDIPYEVYGQFINRDGTLRWDADGLPICNVAGEHSDPAATLDGLGNIWVVWNSRNRAEGEGWPADIYAQKIDPASNEPFLFIDGGAAICSANGTQVEPAICSDGNDGVYVSWTDYRTDEMYGDLYATHLFEDGGPYTGVWDDNGNIVCDAFHRQEDSQIALARRDGSTGAIVVWVDKRASEMEEVASIFMQRIASDGEVAVRESTPTHPVSGLLLDSYPNPFNASTVVSFTIPSAGRYVLDIVDVQGRLLTRLGEGWQEAGRYRNVLTAPQLPSGSYYLVLHSGNATVQSRITLIK